MREGLHSDKSEYWAQAHAEWSGRRGRRGISCSWDEEAAGEAAGSSPCVVHCLSKDLATDNAGGDDDYGDDDADDEEKNLFYWDAGLYLSGRPIVPDTS